MTFNLIKLYTADDKKSYFEDIMITTNIKKELGLYSKSILFAI